MKIIISKGKTIIPSNYFKLDHSSKFLSIFQYFIKTKLPGFYSEVFNYDFFQMAPYIQHDSNEFAPYCTLYL